MMSTGPQTASMASEHESAVLRLETVTGPSDLFSVSGKDQTYGSWPYSYCRANQADTFSDFPVGIDLERLNARTVHSEQSTDLWSRLGAELAEKEQEIERMKRACMGRIEDLRKDGALDGVTLNKDSEKDFWSFVGTLPTVEAELVLAGNGNLRAVWDWEDGCHLGVQFLGHGLLQYVCFRQPKGSRHVSRVAGRDTFDGVRKQLEALELGTLLFA